MNKKIEQSNNYNLTYDEDKRAHLNIRLRASGLLYWLRASGLPAGHVSVNAPGHNRGSLRRFQLESLRPRCCFTG